MTETAKSIPKTGLWVLPIPQKKQKKFIEKIGQSINSEWPCF